MYRDESKGFVKLGLKETKEARRQVTTSEREEAEAEQVAEQSGTDSCIIGQDRERKWVHDYIAENGSWIADGLTELKAAVSILQKIIQNEERRKQVQAKKVYWETESRNGLKFLRHGARNKAVQDWATRVAELERRLRIELIPIWIGNPGAKAEDESYSTDEWGLQEEHFQLLLQEFQVQPTIDAFASHFNNRCASFYSKTSQQGAAGIDFFAQELRQGEVYYCCPPVKLAAHCIRRIWSSKGIQAVLVLPHWAGASYWPLLLDRESYKPEVKQWRSWRAESRDTGRAASLFTTGRNVQMWAGLIRTGKDWD